MKSRHIYAFIAVAAVLIGGVATYNINGSDTQSQLKTRLFLNWFLTASFAGDVVAAEVFAPEAGLEIEINAGGEGRDPLKLVRDGDFGVASADEIIRAIDKGADVVIIGVLQDRNPTLFAALKEHNITKPSDFIGKRVGIIPFGATSLIYSAMMSNAGVDRSKVEEVTISFDLKPFISGRVNDVQPIFAYDETISLDAQGIPYTTVDPRDYGVDFKGQAYFTTTATYETQRDLVEAFLEASVKGWKSIKQDTEKAVSLIAQSGPSVDEAREREMLSRAMPYFVPENGRVLTTDPEQWDGMIKTLVRTETISAPLDPNAFIQLKALETVYDRIGG